MKDEKEPVLEDIRTLLETPYINVYDLVYEDGLHYFDASRRKKEDLAADGKESLPDAVGGFVILCEDDEEPRLLLFQEYRYPAGRYVLSIPSGLIDEKDRKCDDPVRSAMIRELEEETGITLTDADEVFVVDPFVFNTPGMSDESTALVCCLVRGKENRLSHAGAEGSERFEGFEAVTKREALRILCAGKDPAGNPYPLVTWAGLMYFVSDLWRKKEDFYG